MIRNYFKIAVRNLAGNRLYTALNVAGLSVGLAGAILVLLWITDELQYDSFHANLPRIHLILGNQVHGAQTDTYQSTPGPLAAALRADVPEMAKVARTTFSNRFLVNREEKSTYEDGFYAEPEFFGIFRFAALYGDPAAALQDPGSVVISRRMAAKYFGDGNPLGQVLRFDGRYDLKVGAVVADIPANSSVRFDVALPFHLFEQAQSEWVNRDWNNNALPTWAEIQPGADLVQLNARLQDYVQSKDPGAVAHVFAYPLAEWRLNGKFSNGRPAGGRIYMLYLLGILGGFVVLIACINFMNLATARSAHRLREIGVRKVMGAARRFIVGQFLTEALLMTGLALIMSLLCVQLLLPSFNELLDKDIALRFSNWPQWTALLALGLATGLVAGSYPAWYLSGFQPLRVLKDEIGTPGKGGSRLRKGLVTLQFMISVFLIISTIVIHLQVRHGMARPIGYEPENLLRIPVQGDMGRHYEVFKQELLQIPGVTAVSAGRDNLIQYGTQTTGIGWPGKTPDQDFLITVTAAGYDFTKTTGMQIVEGRDFDPAFGRDTLGCLLNRAAVRRMGLQEPVAGTVLHTDTAITVLGVVEDFLFNDPTASPAPLVVFFTKNELNTFYVRLRNDGNWQESLARVDQAAKKQFPQYPVEIEFVKEEYRETFRGIRSTANLSNIFGGLAIFIACLGLFGLSAFVAERRKKEIGIRKVLGAGVGKVWYLLSKDFFQPVLLGFLLAAPLAGLAMQALLQTMEYHIGLSWWIFAAAFVVIVLVAGLTVSVQGVKAALANPVKSLRNE